MLVTESLSTLAFTLFSFLSLCRLFAALNAMRIPTMEKYKLKSFEFSQNYIFFWDKFEKSNYFFNTMIELRETDLNDRTLHWLLQSVNLSADGGQWVHFVNIVEKYGVVPKVSASSLLNLTIHVP